jgi:hypothetical protein
MQSEQLVVEKVYLRYIQNFDVINILNKRKRKNHHNK